MTEIELPTGQSYRFSYDIYGLIEKIEYPSGGEEQFDYQPVSPLTKQEPNTVGWQTNFGVVNRRLYPVPNGSFYQWAYSATYVDTTGYKVSILKPDGTLSERFLYQGNQPCIGGGCDTGSFGYDNILAGMQYESRTYDSANPRRLVSQSITTWTSTHFPAVALGVPNWHPRVVKKEARIFDDSGNGISATTTIDYEGDLNLRDTPLLTKKSSQYAFVPVGDSIPSSPVRSTETTYLINDPNYSGVKSHYIAQNMIGLVTASEVKNSNGQIVSRSETVYDDVSNYPLHTPAILPTRWNPPANGYRGNPNTIRVWDSTKGDPTSSSSYISTHAQFDNFGNQIKAWDAKGNYTTTDYDSTHYAFPVQVASPIPDTTGQHGSNSSFVTTTTYNFTTGLPLTTTDANGLETKIDYDPDTLRPIRTRTYQNSVQVGSTAETIYHDEPNNYWVKNRSQIDETNWAETITYFDGLGRGWKTERIHSDGNIFVEKEFDAEGRTLRVTNPFRANETKRWTTNIFDDASRVIEVVLPDGAKVKTDYGVSLSGVIGVTKLITDQAGKKRQGFTDALGRMVRVVEDPTGQSLVTDYTFDTLGNLRKTVQGEQNRYFYHDSLGRLLRAKQPEQDVNTYLALATADPVTGHNQWSVAYEYDDNGNITESTDARGVSITGTYDNLNRIKTRNYSDSTPDVSFYYDGRGLTSIPAFSNGKTTRVASSVSETRFTSFDNLGRLLTHEQITDGKTYSTSYTYTLSGALLEETYPSGRKVKSVLDSNGELAMLQSSKCLDGLPGTSGACTALAGLWNYADNFTYNTAGGVTKMQLGNGRWETAKYNNREQVTEIGLGATNATQNLLKLELGYGDNTENNGSVREQKITVPTADQTPGFVATQTYLYDDLNRIQSASESIGGNQTWKQTFVIDRYGNRRFDTSNGNTTTLASCTEAVCNPDISTARNRITTAGYQYDENGNLTRDGEGKRFEYDAENHQNAFFLADNPTSTPDATYLYDGEGRRVKKISDTETTVFVYNAPGQLVAEYSTQIETVKPQV
ncbi:MAG TPA: hypothetical protein PKE66_05665, partial [Pyrinomonadaceae bacterium]|nr:hypothetical protein [Pyrinomonadaceae bacterium]